MVFIFAKKTPAGPVVNAGIAWDTETSRFTIERGGTVPQLVFADLLVDTGATISSISTECIQRLSLSVRSQVPLKTASNRPHEMRNGYLVDLYLSDATSSTTHRVIQVIEYFGADSDVQGLLGWDVLQHCDLTYAKATGHFSLQF